MIYRSQQPAMPQATRCPVCRHMDVTTVCRFCSVDKIEYKAAPMISAAKAQINNQMRAEMKR